MVLIGRVFLKPRKARGVGVGSVFEANLDFDRDRIAGLNAIHCFANSTYFSWDTGSTLFFWRWPVSFRSAARDGFPSYLKGSLPSFKRKPRPLRLEQRALFFF